MLSALTTLGAIATLAAAPATGTTTPVKTPTTGTTVRQPGVGYPPITEHAPNGIFTWSLIDDKTKQEKPIFDVRTQKQGNYDVFDFSVKSLNDIDPDAELHELKISIKNLGAPKPIILPTTGEQLAGSSNQIDASEDKQLVVGPTGLMNSMTAVKQDYANKTVTWDLKLGTTQQREAFGFEALLGSFGKPAPKLPLPAPAVLTYEITVEANIYIDGDMKTTKLWGWHNIQTKLYVSDQGTIKSTHSDLDFEKNAGATARLGE